METIATYIYSLRAYQMKSKLEDAGIKVFMEIESKKNPDSAIMEQGVALKVMPEDASAARQILDKLSLEANQQTLEHEPTIHKILVPVDFSEQTEQVCNYAIDLATRFKSEVLIMHACYIPSLDAALLSEASVYSVTLDEHLHNLELTAQESLNKLISRIQQRITMENLNIPVKQLLVKGFADDEIFIVYQEYQPDLIIMGNSSRGIKSHKMYGSVTSEIIDNVLVPVLVAPSKPSLSDLRNIHSILYLTNFDNTDYRAIHKLIYLVSPFNLQIHVVHLGGFNPGDWNEIKLEGIKERLRKEFAGFNVRTEIINGSDQLEKLEEYIDKQQIDMLSMVTHKRNFISRMFKTNLTEKLLFNSTKPMLIFH